jgi:hypothetical protein
LIEAAQDFFGIVAFSVFTEQKSRGCLETFGAPASTGWERRRRTEQVTNSRRFMKSIHHMILGAHGRAPIE